MSIFHPRGGSLGVFRENQCFALRLRCFSQAQISPAMRVRSGALELLIVVEKRDTDVRPQTDGALIADDSGEDCPPSASQTCECQYDCPHSTNHIAQVPVSGIWTAGSRHSLICTYAFGHQCTYSAVRRASASSFTSHSESFIYRLLVLYVREGSTRLPVLP